MGTFQYRDLPQIPFSSEDPPCIVWGPEHMPFRQGPHEVEEAYGYSVKVNNDMLGFIPGLLHANLDQDMSSHRHNFRQYQQWVPPMLSRNISPDTASSSDNSSYATQPEEVVHYSSPYAIIDRVKEDSSPTDFINSMREVEYEHELEPEITVGEAVADDIEEDIEALHELTKTDSGCISIDSEPGGYKDSSESTVGRSWRDPESVHPMDPSEGESSDAEYVPNRSAKRRRSSASTNSSGRQSRRRKTSSAAAMTPKARVSKRGGKPGAAVNARKTSNNAQYTADSQRYFPCLLTQYSCKSTFSSKNEWKRHISTQHIKLGFWRCDLCATTIDPHDDQTFYHNDFNRKDLFTQHLRRMHAAPPKQSHRNHKEYPITEDNIADHQKKCFLILRETPTHSKCLFCDETFTGINSWENRVEHIGRHLEKDRKAGNKMRDVMGWNVDKDLERWLFDEGIIALDKAGNWKIGDGRPRAQAMNSVDTSDDDV